MDNNIKNQQFDTPARSSLLKEIVAHAYSYGFLYPSSEIYDGCQAIYDYGPYGIALKRNLQSFWWKSMTQLHQNIVGIDSAILMHANTWKASGHVDNFNDPMIDNKDSKKRYRVDVLIENHSAMLVEQGKQKAADFILNKMEDLLKKQDLQGLYDLIITANIQCPISKTTHWSSVKQFNLMFSTHIGSGAPDDSNVVYLRPETAQGIFVNFLSVQKTARMKVPFGIAQIGKAFRNEIIARQFIFRMREFEQMEMQFFIQPDNEKQWFTHWETLRLKWYTALGIPQNKLRIHPHKHLAHYATSAIDIEYEFPFGFKEIEGIHSRTNFDLKNHEFFSHKKMQYFDHAFNTTYIPYVIETSAGCDRVLLMMLCNAFIKESKEDVHNPSGMRTYLNLPPALAPIKAAIFPLINKDDLPVKAENIFNDLKYDFSLVYEAIPSIGKRYARQDVIGTPYCITIDYQTLEDDTVTVRERNTMHQQRIPIGALKNFLLDKGSFSNLLKKV